MQHKPAIPQGLKFNRHYQQDKSVRQARPSPATANSVPSGCQARPMRASGLSLSTCTQHKHTRCFQHQQGARPMWATGNTNAGIRIAYVNLQPGARQALGRAHLAHESCQRQAMKCTSNGHTGPDSNHHYCLPHCCGATVAYPLAQLVQQPNHTKFVLPACSVQSANIQIPSIRCWHTHFFGTPTR